MVPRRFTENDMTEMNRWYLARGANGISRFGDLPTLGFIVPGVAAGFMYVVEGRFGILEGFVSNPEYSRQLRKDALDVITDLLINHAKTVGLGSIMAFTQSEPIKERCVQYDFRPIGQFHLFVRERL